MLKFTLNPDVVIFNICMKLYQNRSIKGIRIIKRFPKIASVTLTLDLKF